MKFIILFLISLSLFGCNPKIHESVIHDSLEYCKDKDGIQYLYIDCVYKTSQSYVKCNDNSIKYLKDFENEIYIK